MKVNDVNWSLLFLVIVIGAIVSFIGDIVGSRFGKRRVSLFGLRPRYSSGIIAAITGVLTAVIILIILSVASDTVHTALLGMKALQKQVSSLSNELKSAELKLTQLKKERKELEQQVKKLREVAEKLRMGLAVVREGNIAVRSHELLWQQVFPPNLPAEEAQKMLEEALLNASRVAYSMGARPQKENGNIVYVLPENFNDVIKEITNSPESKVVRIISVANSLKGEPVFVKLLVYPNKLIYKDGMLLASKKIDGKLGESDIERELYLLLQKVNSKAVKDGVLPDPLKGTVGRISASDFYNVIDKIKRAGRVVDVFVYADGDIYTSGPVNIKIVVK